MYRYICKCINIIELRKKKRSLEFDNHIKLNEFEYQEYPPRLTCTQNLIISLMIAFSQFKVELISIYMCKLKAKKKVLEYFEEDEMNSK